tara:strand:- start:143 stop:706 length:564 start_codon:yes stop_codon:yes gene_type:complete
MRIISGFLKGKTLNYIKNSKTRPLKDIVRENIFNILNHSNLIKINLLNSKVLDTYSGIGSFGIECLSRGAKKTTFVESNNEASKILKENLSILSISDKTFVFDDKIEKFLRINKKEKYNIIFFDPPYSDSSFIKNLQSIKDNKMYEAKHIIIIHRERETWDGLKDYIDILITKKYGRSKIFFGIFSK